MTEGLAVVVRGPAVAVVVADVCGDVDDGGGGGGDGCGGGVDENDAAYRPEDDSGSFSRPHDPAASVAAVVGVRKLPFSTAREATRSAGTPISLAARSPEIASSSAYYTRWYRLPTSKYDNIFR